MSETCSQQYSKNSRASMCPVLVGRNELLICIPLWLGLPAIPLELGRCISSILTTTSEGEADFYVAGVYGFPSFRLN